MSEAPIVVNDPSESRDNEVRPFAIEGMDVKGRAVRLGTVVDQIISAHDYPDSVNLILGEMIALASLLGSMLKFEGVVTVQTKSGGAVPMMVVDYEVNTDGDHAIRIGHVRGCASVDETKMSHYGAMPSFEALIGSKQGYMALTIDQGADMDRYQGIVELAGTTLSDVSRNYFQNSEQTPTEIKLVSGKDEVTGHWRAGGIMVQHLAHGEEGQTRLTAREEEKGLTSEEDAWARASVLMNSVKADELTDPQLDLDQLLYRLFNEDGVRVFDPVRIEKGCRCNREHLLGIIRQFGADDLSEMVVDGLISVNCQFCNRNYDFKPTEAGLDS